MQQKLINKDKLYYRKAILEDSRDDNYLLVWRELGSWLIVDQELYTFLNSFIEGRALTLREKESEEINTVVNTLKDKNILYQTGYLKIPKLSEIPKIANMTYNITNRCNFNCKWCYNKNRISNELSVKEFIKKVLAEKDIYAEDLTLIILGGEPFLRFEALTEVVKRLGDFFPKPIQISTNGSLINEVDLERLPKDRVEIQVSLDGPTSEINDAIRGKRSFDKATAGIETLVREGYHTILSMVYSRDSLDYFEDYLELGKNLGVDEVRFIPMRTIGKGEALKEILPDQYKAFLKYKQVLTDNPQYKKFLGRDFFSIIASVCKYTACRINCGLGYKVIFIDADGKVYPCPNFVDEKYFAGSLAETELKEIFLNSEVMNDFREDFKVDNYIGCKSCDFKYWCAGDCRAEVMSVSNDRFACSHHCVELKRLYFDVLWLLGEGFWEGLEEGSEFL